MKLRLFEFEDQKWFPNTLRESMTDYLRYFLTFTNFYKPVTPLLSHCLAHHNERTCIDLCSGGGGAIEAVVKNLKEETNLDVRFVLTDMFPNLTAFEFLKQRIRDRVDYVAISVDASSVPYELKGVRTIYSAIHHFTPAQVKSVLQDAANARAPIAIFDGGDRSVFLILGMLLFHPIAFFLFTPFFRPLKLSRIIFTYLLPLVPLCTIWDGVVSILRLYQPRELLEIAQDVKGDYRWKGGKVKNAFGMNITYLIGVPRREIKD